MPSHSAIRIDFQGLGIPPGRYALPGPGNLLEIAADPEETRGRLEQHFLGKLALSDLTEDEVTFLRSFFLEQVAEHRELALASFDRRVPRRYAAVRPDERASLWAAAVTRDPQNTRSLLLLGPTGTGKTHFAYSALKAVSQTGARMSWLVFTTADLYAHLRPHGGRDDQAEYNAVAGIDLLVLDDLGAAKFTEWTEEVTFRLINERYEKCLPCILTSNLPPAQLTNELGGRVASRLTEMCDRIAFKGEDRRKGQAR